jgi:hypothetical protein
VQLRKNAPLRGFAKRRPCIEHVIKFFELGVARMIQPGFEYGNLCLQPSAN